MWAPVLQVPSNVVHSSNGATHKRIFSGKSGKTIKKSRWKPENHAGKLSGKTAQAKKVIGVKFWLAGKSRKWRECKVHSVNGEKVMMKPTAAMHEVKSGPEIITRDEQFPGICANRKKCANGRLADWSFGVIRIAKFQTFGSEMKRTPENQCWSL